MASGGAGGLPPKVPASMSTESKAVLRLAMPSAWSMGMKLGPWPSSVAAVTTSLIACPVAEPATKSASTYCVLPASAMFFGSISET